MSPYSCQRTQVLSAALTLTLAASTHLSDVSSGVRDSLGTTLRCRRLWVTLAGHSSAIYVTSGKFARDPEILLRCPSTSTAAVCVCRSSQVKLHWPPDLASSPLHQRAHHGAHAQDRPCRWAEQGSRSHKKRQEGQAFSQQRSKYAAHPHAVATPRSLVFVQTSAYPNSHSGCGLTSAFCMRIIAAAAETRQANKAHP